LVSAEFITNSQINQVIFWIFKYLPKYVVFNRLSKHGPLQKHVSKTKKILSKDPKICKVVLIKNLGYFINNVDIVFCSCIEYNNKINCEQYANALINKASDTRGLQVSLGLRQVFVNFGCILCVNWNQRIVYITLKLLRK